VNVRAGKAMKVKSPLAILKESLTFEDKGVESLQNIAFKTTVEGIKIVNTIYNNLAYHDKQTLKHAILAGQILICFKQLCKVEKVNLSSLLNENNIKWKTSYVNFLISLYNFSKDYPKIRKVSCSIHYIKNNFANIKTAIWSSDEEQEFWQQA